MYLSQKVNLGTINHNLSVSNCCKLQLQLFKKEKKNPPFCSFLQRCVEYVDVASGLPTAAGLPFWIVQALSIHPEPQRPRCRRYELDVTKPKMWQFFETVYDDAYSLVDNSRSEEPR